MLSVTDGKTEPRFPRAHSSWSLTVSSHNGRAQQAALASLIWAVTLFMKTPFSWSEQLPSSTTEG